MNTEQQRDPDDTIQNAVKGRKGVVMCIEEKPGLAGHARIGRVTISESRRSIYYGGRHFSKAR